MKAKIKTKIPGPKSKALSKIRFKSVARGHGSVCGVFIKKAIGSNLIDVDGNIFIDYAGGIGTMNVGHSHPNVLTAVKKQIGKFIHPCFTVAPYEPYVALANKLSELAPISRSCKGAFFNSGAEAIENAVKISKSYTKRNGIIVFSHAFHGRTQMTMSMTFKENPYKKGFGPFLPNIHCIEFPSDKKPFQLDSLNFNPKTIACAVIEPVAGEGGFIPVSMESMKKLRKFCSKHGIVFISDEIQTGFGRTGSIFAIEQFGVEPDLIAVAKSVAGGLPLSGVIGKSEIMDATHIGGIGGTFGGNPVSCAAALAVLEIIEREKLTKQAFKIGKKVRKTIKNIIGQCPWVGEIRGIGAMQGIVIIDPKTGNPDKDRTSRIHQHALENGLIMITAGTYGNVIRTLMPLTIGKSELNQSLKILSDAIQNA